MKKRLLIILIGICVISMLAAPLLLAGCGDEEETTTTTPTTTEAPTKDTIIIGGARPLTGQGAVYEETAFGPIYKMWIDKINADGGLYIEEYGKKLPIEYKEYIYDDTSDVSVTLRLLEKLMTVDKVDFVLPPAGTNFLFAAAPIFNKYGYILLGAEGGATSLENQLPGLPYFFGVLSYSNRNQIPVFADICQEVGIESVAIIFLQDLHGIEYNGTANKEFNEAGIEIKMSKSVPIEVDDVSLLLLEAQDLEVDALCIFAYPAQVFLTIGTAMGMGINFDAILTGVGGCFNAFPLAVFSPEIVEGVMFEGAWNTKSSPEAAAFYEQFSAIYPEAIADWWGHTLYWGALEFFEQAIVEAGTLDQSVIREVMATHTFDTVLGPTWFDQFGDGGCLLAVECHLGEIGQWQNGYPEVIDPGENRTADPIYPKPDWPAAP